MSTRELRVSDEVSAAAWIAPRLTNVFGSVTKTLPSGYPAYVRICHPAADHDSMSATWSKVAQTTGRKAHPLMQWHALVGSRDPNNTRGSLWPFNSPERGNLAPEVLGPLCDLLADHTATPERCFFCLWDGYGWIRGGPAVDESIPATFSPEELSRPRVHLHDRDYLLLLGPLPAALHIGVSPRAGWSIAQSPNLFWPADQAWCVATEIDFDSTLVGGSTELVDAILQAQTFDSWPIQPDDLLAADADRINRIP